MPQKLNSERRKMERDKAISIFEREIENIGHHKSLAQKLLDLVYNPRLTEGDIKNFVRGYKEGYDSGVKNEAEMWRM